jgi:flagellar basal-body rod protein FlgB
MNQRSLEPTRVNGNNVNLDHETLTHIDTNLRYQLMLRVIDGKISTLRTAMGTS